MKTHQLRLPGANSRNRLLPEPLPVTYFQKKTGSWKELHRRNCTSLGKRTCQKTGGYGKKELLFPRESMRQALGPNATVLAHTPLAATGFCYGVPVQESLAMVSHVRLSLLNLQQEEEQPKRHLPSLLQGGKHTCQSSSRNRAWDLVDEPLSLSNCVLQSPFYPNLQRMG